MRYLGIDYGTKRIGLALSDEAGGMAFPYGVLDNDKKKFVAIKKICDDNKVGGIVCGVPIGLKMQETAMTIAVRAFAEKLEAHIGIKVHLVNELFSSKEAAHFQGTHSKIDASAAALILEDYLKQNRSNG
jgi:putative Holliday junction resolvase